jgi:hypothetical protein
MSFQKRLTLAIKELGLTKNSFAEKLGYETNTLIYSYTREDDKKKEPGFEFFERLIRSKVGINLDWLLIGEGDMFNKKGTAATNSDEAAVLRIAVKELSAQLQFMRDENSKLSVNYINLTEALMKRKVIEKTK